MKEYYVFSDQKSAQKCVDEINKTSCFPIIGNVDGRPAPNNQQTVRWCTVERRMKSGSYAVPKMPDRKLDDLNVPKAERDVFKASYGRDKRALTDDDFVKPESPI